MATDRLVKMAAERAYKNINDTYGLLTDLEIFLKNSERSKGTPDHVKEELLHVIKGAEKQCKKAYDWIYAIMES